MSQLILAVLPAMEPRRIEQTLVRSLATHPRVCALVAPEHHRALVVRHLAERDVAPLPESPSPSVGGCLGPGVQFRPQARGWILMPADVADIPAGLLPAMSRAVAEHVVVHAQSHGRRCYPVGISMDLYGDAVRVHTQDRLMRLLARYPAHAVNFDEVEQSGFALSTLEAPWP